MTTQYLVCTFNDPQIHVDFGIYGAVSKYMVFNAHYLINVRLRSGNDEVVEVELAESFNGNHKVWSVTWHADFMTDTVMLVQSLDGVAPTSAMDLLTKIATYMR